MSAEPRFETPVVLLRLDGDRTVDAQRWSAGAWQPLPAPRPRASDALNDLADRHPDDWLAWQHRAWAPRLTAVEQWPSLCWSRLEWPHLGGVEASHRRALSLGFVAFDTPYLRAAPRDRPFATGLVGPAAGMVHARALVACGFNPSLDWPVALIDAACRGQRLGLRPRAEPRLLRPSNPDLGHDTGALPAAEPLSNDQVATLIRRLHGRRWLGFWLLAGLGFNRRLHLGSALRARRQPGARPVDVAALAALVPPRSTTPINDAVSVVIPTLGRPDHVLNLVRDLSAQTHMPARVVVVEQGMEAEATALAPLDTMALPFEVNRITVDWSGACRGRNVGLARADGEWVLLLDDDVRLTAHVVSDLLRTAHDHGVDSVQARVYQPDEPAPIAAHPDDPDRPLRPPRPWPNFASGAALVRRSALAKAGAFDVRHEGGFGEDYEYGVRLLRAGVETLRDEHVGILHLKAPRGGFRQPLPMPWAGEPVAPKPSPTVLYSRARHLTTEQRQGYRLFYVIKRLLARPVYRWPAELLRVRRQWRVAQRWCDTLLRQADNDSATNDSTGNDSATNAPGKSSP